jgi:putative selenate reductase molybdopterin-binding subunit
MTLRRASGEAAFAGDLARPSALHLAVRRSPLAHGRLVRADATDARALPGVVMVVTADEGAGILDSELRHVGDRAAFVAAEDAELARRGADMIRLDLAPRPVVLDPESALAEPGQVAARVDVTTGDPAAAFEGADQTIEGTWSLPFAPTLPLEPSVALTWLDEDRRLVVRTSAESPFRVRRLLAERLGLPAARIRVTRPLVAGGAPRRSEVSIEDLCALVTLRTGRPARLALTADEELATAPGRPPQHATLRLALRKGRVVGVHLRLLVDLGDSAEGAEEFLRSAGRQALGIYAVPHSRFEAAAVRTNRPPTCAPRGADHAAALALECAMDEAAAALEEDPGAFRRRHLRSAGGAGAAALVELGEDPLHDDARPLEELLRAGTAGLEIRAPRNGRRLSESSPAVGLGVARRTPASASGAGAAASLHLLDDGSFTLAAAPSSAGGGDETAYAEAVAAILAVPVRRIVLATADTDSAPFEAGDPGPVFFATGRAVERAAEEARHRILDAGARMLGASIDEVTIADGQVRDSRGRAADYAAIGAWSLRAGQPLVATAAPPLARMPSAHAVVVAEVEVDAPTGIVRVLGLSAVVAGGSLEDPRPAEGQIEGALAAAVERSLAATLPFDGEGRPARPSLRHWPVATALDVPPLSVRLLSVGEPLSRFGAAAVGEAAGQAALAAIANAVARATGVPVRTLPLGPDRLQAASSAAAGGLP